MSDKVKVKEHVFRELVNNLRDTAVKYKNTQQLREQLARTLGEVLTTNIHPEGK